MRAAAVPSPEGTVRQALAAPSLPSVPSGLCGIGGAITVLTGALPVAEAAWGVMRAPAVPKPDGPARQVLDSPFPVSVLKDLAEIEGCPS